MQNKENMLDTVNSIKSIEMEIESTKGHVKIINEMIADYIQSKQEWLDLESAKEETKRLSDALKNVLANDADYNNNLEELGQLKDKLKSQKEIISDLIVGYKLETRENQIEIGSNGEARQLVLKGKLGKRGKYQTSIFSDSNSKLN